MFEERLNSARNGSGILFCGAGFSADCLNFVDERELGVGSHLLEILNDAIRNSGNEAGYKDLRNAADGAAECLGEHGLLALLQNRFKLESVTADMVDICTFPWARIYTTNYDNGIELAASRAKVNARAFNNLDEPKTMRPECTSIIHLHGRAESWDIRNFRNSCILGMESYHSLQLLKNWLDLFRQDLDRAKIVVFVGFNANDFHLNEVLRDLYGLKEKLFFVNRPSAVPDLDVKRSQLRFGTPLYLGRQGLADSVRRVRSLEKPIEPTLSSFVRYERALPFDDVPSTKSIEDLFVFGRVEKSALARDVDKNLSEYHISRKIVHEILEDVDSGANVILIFGDICDGKSVAIEDLQRRIDVVRPVFLLRIPYDDILDEVSRILLVYPNAAIVLENCFELSRERLIGLSRLFHDSGAVLIMSSRSIAAEARVSDLSMLRELKSFREYRMPSLDDEEATALITLTDQIAGWSQFRGTSDTERLNFIRVSCNSSLPSFLMRLLRSEYVKNRYKEEYNKTSTLSETDQLAIVAALYISHIGERPRANFLSDVFKFDFGGRLSRFNEDGVGLRLVRMRGDFVETVPSIGATNILRDIVADRLVVDVVSEVLRRLSEDVRRDDFRRHVFSQLMRYSIIQPVIEDEKWIGRFFDKISKIDYVRRQVLFWLQWSISLREQKQFSEAEVKLEQGYREAEAYEKRKGVSFDRKQLDDVRAKLIISSSLNSTVEPTKVFRDIKTATEIVGKLLHHAEITHHPYETLEGIVRLYCQKISVIDPTLQKLALQAIEGVIKLAEKRIGVVPVGYQTSKATDAMKTMKGLLGPA